MAVRVQAGRAAGAAIMMEEEQASANIRRLVEIAADLEEMADGYREKADMLLREAARIRIAADREIARQAAAACQRKPVEPREQP